MQSNKNITRVFVCLLEMNKLKMKFIWENRQASKRQAIFNILKIVIYRRREGIGQREQVYRAVSLEYTCFYRFDVNILCILKQH